MWGERVRVAGARGVSGAGPAVFRCAFGIAVTVNALMYLPDLADAYYADAAFHFGYPPLTFVQPPPGPWLRLVYAGMVVAGLLIAAGLWYRAACAAFFTLTTYVFLLDSSFYQNHEYLLSLLSFLMIFLPLHSSWSLDARLRPAVASPTVPAWVVWLLRFQIGVPYVFGGLAKLNGDWLRGEPLRGWLAERADFPLVGRFFTEEPVVLAMAYGSLVFDLTVAGLLSHRRTRAWAFAAAVCFHLANARLWGLFIFPWLMIPATTVFFPPDWPRRLLHRVREPTPAPAPALVPVPVPVPVPVTAPVPVPVAAPVAARRAAVRPALALCLAAWATVQMLLPLRHLLIPGPANWTEEGHRYAWHMMLRAKEGTAAFILTDGRRVWRIDNADYLTPEQEARLAGHPERLVLFAHFLSEEFDGAEVRVRAWVALNGRDPALLIDPDVDLSRIPVPWWGHADWILPLDEPLPGP
ncbi:HTTM domain-containing protein [Streptomyces sp. NBC_01803]|uniref:HTTM domain-containing protein n=1 Tax=Streptomyces sp. NBC_01803 TaxID=2975946 RepID=UPI002DD82137|nr:HTTM domain-containing protein [Streptomyces sp. NBC_01803]WSA46269.1 HTTM domain-containing protein [Streptomyces sp. NBC_01803]